MPVITVATLDELNQRKQSSSRGLVLHFGASWCAPSAELQELIVSQYAGVWAEKVDFGYVDVDTAHDVVEAEGVEAVPFLIFYRFQNPSSTSLERVAEVSGAKVAELSHNLQSIYGPADGLARASFENIDDFIRSVLKRDRIVVFITGTPSAPRCGFTKKVLGLLNSVNATYTYFDVMSDEELCQRLKTFSNWPTYPQVYVDGELIGGCDVCTQLAEEGELATALKIA